MGLPVNAMTMGVMVWLGMCGLADLRTGTAPNWLTLPGVAGGALVAYQRGLPGMASLGVVALVLSFVYFRGGVGGADVKVLLALGGLRPDLLVAGVVGVTVWGLIHRSVVSGTSFRALPVVALACAISFAVSWLGVGLS